MHARGRMQMSLPKKSPRKFMQARRKRETAMHLSLKHARDSCHRRFRRRPWGKKCCWYVMLHRSIFQACSRKTQKQRSRPKKRRERCLQRGSSVTPGLVGKRIVAARRIKTARGRQGRFNFAPVRPVAVPGGDLGLTEPIFWYCRATLAFTQVMRR